MPDETAPKPCPPDPVEAEFAEALRGAAFIFEKQVNGRFLGSILACRAVARFIHQRGGAAELAGPFLAIAESFKDLERGGQPRLFAKKTEPVKERDRSPERKHIQMLAAAVLEVLIQLKADTRANWADRIARHVNKWPGMGNQKITGRTVIAWRNLQGKLSDEARKPFKTVVEQILSAPEPLQEVLRLLRSGPPGLFRD